MAKRPDPLLALLYQAHFSALGGEIPTNKPDLLLQKLYKARNFSHDPKLSELSLRISTDRKSVYILHRNPEDLPDAS